jgi:protein SCO1/2
MRFLLLWALLLLTACAPPPAKFNATELKDVPWGRGFALTGHDGKSYRLADFEGRAVILFFGYTQCPDVCPVTMGGLRELMAVLGDESKRVQVVFVTVDPERDTPQLLAQYVPAFHPSFLGLYGDARATADVAAEFKVFYRKQPPNSSGAYTVDHTAGSYVFDPAGRLRLYFRHGESPGRMAEDLRSLLAGA